MVYAEIFEAFFLQADMDCDGVISGPEAVNFFKAIDIPQPTLAKVWKFVDEGQRGFLSRQEFYNALKLITVAQTGRELTPELMKAAIRGTTTSQIPPPRLTRIQKISNIPKTINNGARLDTSSPITGLSQDPFLSMISNLGCKERTQAKPSIKTPWPKMTAFDIQRYVHAFNQIDIDEDEKISGDQTRNLFSSWQLPKEVLRNAWSLSDQDGDNMLSKREFCTMVYLLEKFTEGFCLPLELPMDIHLDESLALGRPESRLSFYHSIVFATPNVSIENSLSTNKETAKSISPLFHAYNHFTNKSDECHEDHTSTLMMSITPAMQVVDLNKWMMSQKEKLEYYYSKLQEIGLFKSQCDNKCAQMMKKIIEYKNEVNFLSWQCDLKSKFALKVKTPMAVENSTLNENKIALDLLAFELQELKKLLVDKARSLGVDIKQEFPKKVFFEAFLEESNTNTSAITNDEPEVYNLKASKPHFEAEIESSLMIDTIKTEESVIVRSRIKSNIESDTPRHWKVNLDNNTNSGCQTSWSGQKNSQSIEILGEIQKLKSRGSFEPEDYFDLIPLNDLNIQSPFSQGSTMEFDNHIRTNHQEACPNNLQP